MWSRSWHLSFKVCCCAVFIVLLILFFPSIPHILIINDHPVVTIESYQDLGIIISEDFSWELHYELITSRAYKTLGLMWRTLVGAQCTSTKRSLYQSMVKPKLTYCSPIWRPHLLKDIKALSKAGNKMTTTRATSFLSACYH